MPDTTDFSLDASAPRDGLQLDSPPFVPRALRWALPIDADIWQKQRDLGLVTPADEAVLSEERFRLHGTKIGLGLGALGPTLYGKFIRKQPWPATRIAGLTMICTTLGLFVGQLSDAAGDALIIRSCSNPMAVNTAITSAVREQLRRDRARLDGSRPSRREGFPPPVSERPDIPGREADVLDRMGGRDSMWSGEEASDSSVGPVTRELEQQPGGWRRFREGASDARPPHPSPRSAETATPVPSPPLSGTEKREESAWEALRHGRIPPKKGKPKQENQGPTPAFPAVPDSETGDTPSYDTPIGLDDFEEPSGQDNEERKKAQKEFDELLERERQFGLDGPGRRRPGGKDTW